MCVVRLFGTPRKLDCYQHRGSTSLLSKLRLGLPWLKNPPLSRKRNVGSMSKYINIDWEDFGVAWRVQAIRGATTVSENSIEAIREAVTELLDELEANNQIKPEQIISTTFSVTCDLDAIFPAAIARQRPQWNNVPLLDVQQMHVEGSLERCIRFLICLLYTSPSPRDRG